MALTADFRIESVTTDGVYTTIQDYTTYGSPNLNRNQIAVVATAYKVDEDLLETSMTITPDDADPYLTTQFVLDNRIGGVATDGWMKVYISLIPKWDAVPSTVYNKYDVVYDTTGVDGYYQYINSTPSSGNATSDTNYWQLITDPTKAIIEKVGTSEAVGNLTYQVFNFISKYQAQKCYVKVAAKVSKDHCLEENQVNSVFYTTFTKLDSLLNVAYIDEAQGLFLAGERAMRLAERYCNDCGCGVNSNY